MNIFQRIGASAKFVFSSPKAYTNTNTNNYRSGGAKFRNGIPRSGQTITLNNREVRANARVAEQDSPTAKALIDRRADTVADVGLRLECMPKINILGISEEEAEKWGDDVEQRWELFSNSKLQHRSEVMTFNSSNSLYQKDDERDGENFIRLYYSKDRSLISPLQFEFIDPNQIRGHAVTSTYAQTWTKDGIERDSRGRETAFNIWFIDSDGKYQTEKIKKVGIKSKRIFMLHGFVPDLPGQKRGVSKLAPILQEFTQLTNFTLAQIEKAINQSQMVFFTKNNTQDPSNPLDDMPTRKPTFSTTQNDSDDIYAEPTAAEVDWCDISDTVSSKPGSTFVGNLIQGDDIQAVPQTAPSIGYADFIDSLTATLSATRGMPQEVLKMKFQSNYSASRGALVLFWRVAIIRRQEMIDSMHNPIFEMWLSEEIAVGRIKAPGWNDPRKKAAWLNCEWYGSPMPNINPLQEAKANKENLGIHATSVDRVARDTNGSNGKSNMAKNRRSFEDMPVPYWQKDESIDENEDFEE